MLWDSVSITVASYSYSTDQINYLSALALLPILLFLHILFKSMLLWNQTVFMPPQGQKIDCLTDGTERRKQTKPSLVIRKKGNCFNNYMRNSMEMFTSYATPFILALLMWSNEVLSMSLYHMYSTLLWSWGPSFPFCCKHPQREREGHPLIFAHTSRASKHWQISAKANTNIYYSWQTISGFDWNIKNVLCEPCQTLSRLWAARVNMLHVS